VPDEILSTLSEREKRNQIDDRIAISFSVEVLELMKTDNINSIDATLAVCTRHGIPEDEVDGLISPKLLNELTKTAETLKLIKRSSRTKRVF